MTDCFDIGASFDSAAFYRKASGTLRRLSTIGEFLTDDDLQLCAHLLFLRQSAVLIGTRVTAFTASNFRAPQYESLDCRVNMEHHPSEHRCVPVFFGVGLLGFVVHASNHFSLLVVDVGNDLGYHCAYHFDSMSESAQLHALHARYALAVYNTLHKCGILYDTDPATQQPRGIVSLGIQQTDYNCGVFTLLVMHYLDEMFCQQSQHVFSSAEAQRSFRAQLVQSVYLRYFNDETASEFRELLHQRIRYMLLVRAVAIPKHDMKPADEEYEAENHSLMQRADEARATSDALAELATSEHGVVDLSAVHNIAHGGRVSTRMCMDALRDMFPFVDVYRADLRAPLDVSDACDHSDVATNVAHIVESARICAIVVSTLPTGKCNCDRQLLAATQYAVLPVYHSLVVFVGGAAVKRLFYALPADASQARELETCVATLCRGLHASATQLRDPTQPCNAPRTRVDCSGALSVLEFARALSYNGSAAARELLHSPNVADLIAAQLDLARAVKVSQRWTRLHNAVAARLWTRMHNSLYAIDSVRPLRASHQMFDVARERAREMNHELLNMLGLSTKKTEQQILNDELDATLALIKTATVPPVGYTMHAQSAQQIATNIQAVYHAQLGTFVASLAPQWRTCVSLLRKWHSAPAQLIYPPVLSLLDAARVAFPVLMVRRTLNATLDKSVEYNERDAETQMFSCNCPIRVKFFPVALYFYRTVTSPDNAAAAAATSVSRSNGNVMMDSHVAFVAPQPILSCTYSRVVDLAEAVELLRNDVSHDDVDNTTDVAAHARKNLLHWKNLCQQSAHPSFEASVDSRCNIRARPLLSASSSFTQPEYSPELERLFARIVFYHDFIPAIAVSQQTFNAWWQGEYAMQMQDATRFVRK